MPRILHAADFHLDSPAGALPPEKAAQRRKELLGALSRTVTLAEERKTEILLLPGDLFDADNASVETAEEAARLLSRTGARVFIAPGNHDYYFPKSPYEAVRWPENVHIFKTPRITKVELPELGTAVYGAGFDAPECPRSLLSGFSAREDAGVSLMALHADVNAAAPRYNPVTEAEIARSGLSYLALGHTHAFSGIRRAGDTFYAYPGCPEGRGFDETGEKGVLVGEVSREKCGLSFVPVCARCYGLLEVSLKDGDRALGAALALIPPGSERDIFRLVFTGETGPDGLDMSGLYEALSERFFHLYLSDRTQMRRDIWAQAGEDTLRGLFLKNMRRRFEQAPDGEARRVCELAARYGLAALEGRTPPASGEAGL